jgi:hypothetical protein
MTDLELLDCVLAQHPIVTHRIFLHITQDLKAAAFFGQLYYWSKKMNHEWFYKTVDSWGDELYLSWEEQKRIRKKLIVLGLIEEKRKASPAKLFFKLNFPRLIELAKQYYSQIQGKSESRFRESQNLDSGKVGSLIQGFPESIYKETETTTETTTENKKNNPKGLLKKNVKRSLPEDFGISERVYAWAEEKGYPNSSLKKGLEVLVSYAKRNGKQYVDWDEALMTAVRENWAKLPNDGFVIAAEDDLGF